MDRRLDSWKEIAAYLDRDVTTVRRWERLEGLPVHRHMHGKLGSVYSFTAEIDGWTLARRTGLSNGSAKLVDAPVPATEPTGGLPRADPPASLWPLWAGFALLIVSLFYFTLRSRTLTCEKIQEGYLYLDGASPTFLAHLAPAGEPTSPTP